MGFARNRGAAVAGPPLMTPTLKALPRVGCWLSAESPTGKASFLVGRFFRQHDSRAKEGAGLNGLYQFLTHKTVLLTVGGAAGTNARYWVGVWYRSLPMAVDFPFLGTTFINVSGSFILGAAVFLIEQRLAPEQRYWILLIGTGFCGGYTTFSTFAYETFDVAFRQGSWWLALANVVVSVVGGFVAVVLAVKLADGIFSPP
jgi:CrcB protein